ncbi:heterokaryon incompatibility protein-domain-containing protein [Cadophora sp. MPI-SDFR-AT-0126]|nr:heterokaryon incompatibility protein-domain-containing protein [Leotiomycetes sp. MPI-SDFR-AT-0126]
MDDEQDSVFEYSVLPLEAGEFRILILHASSNPSASIYCSLVQEQLPGLEPYDALSYTWGKDDPNSIIKLNNCKFKIRENLHHALLQLRHTTEDRRIWIDAICINQLSIPERNVQVAQMKDIFANASLVAIWLGHDSNGAKKFALEYIPILTKSIEEPGWVEADDGFRAALDDEDFIKALNCVSYVLENPWWRRIWVIQEVAVAKRDPVVYAGAGSITWEQLWEFHFVASDHHIFGLLYGDGVSSAAKEALADLHDGLGSFDSIARIREIQYNGMEQPLGSITVTGHRYRCTDLRDRIFALLGLVNPPSTLQADYHLSRFRVNVLTMTHLMLESQDLRALSWITGSVDGHGDPSLPSWVPDFGDDRVYHSMFISTDQKILFGKGERLYSASGSSYDYSSLQFEDDGLVLVTRGCIIDSIRRLGDCSPRNSMLWPSVDQFSEVLKSWKTIAQLPIDAAPSADFWRTILVDRDECAVKLPIGTFGKRLGPDAAALPRTVEQETKLISKLYLTPGPHFGRRFVLTANGAMGLAPEMAEGGDQICVLFGGEVPYVVRPLKEGYYKLVGECFVLGVMDSEALEDQKARRDHFQEFRIK